MATDFTTKPKDTPTSNQGIRFELGQGGLPKLKIDTEWSSAEIYLQGAHVTHFQLMGQPPLLFLSHASRFEPGQAIRGGIPIILPWFGSREGMAAHGCARNRTWDIREVSIVPDGWAIRFGLECPMVPGFAPFRADYLVTVGQALGLELVVTNQSSQQGLTFENCLHTYFQVGDITNTSVLGLKGVSYLDKVAAFTQKVETSDVIRISSETDRVYFDTRSSVEIVDPILRRKIVVEKQNSDSTVVWNPWISKAQQMADFGNEEFRRMICVESGNVAPNRITLPPGGSQSLKVRLTCAGL